MRSSKVVQQSPDLGVNGPCILRRQAVLKLWIECIIFDEIFGLGLLTAPCENCISSYVWSEAKVCVSPLAIMFIAGLVRSAAAKDHSNS